MSNNYLLDKELRQLRSIKDEYLIYFKAANADKGFMSDRADWK